MTNRERIERLEQRIKWLEQVIERGFDARDKQIRVLAGRVEQRVFINQRSIKNEQATEYQD